MADYEADFAELPDMVGSRDAMRILNVASIQGIHHIMGHLPDDAPKVLTQELIIGKRKLMLYSKPDLIALRRYRDVKKD